MFENDSTSILSRFEPNEFGIVCDLCTLLAEEKAKSVIG